MPGVARIFTLNLGSQAISVADFRPQSGGGLVLRDYKRRDLARARESWAQATALNPGHQLARANLEMLDLSQ